MKANELGIEVEFLEQSMLRDFLDGQPEGQWLREQHLGIGADQLSRSLLESLAAKSLFRYCCEMQPIASEGIIPTVTAEEAFRSLGDVRTSLPLLLGAPGSGKTVVAQSVVRRYIAHGGLGLWIPGWIAESAASLPDAITTALRTLHPRLSSEAGHDALKLATDANPLLLVLDD